MGCSCGSWGVRVVHGEFRGSMGYLGGFLGVHGVFIGYLGGSWDIRMVHGVFWWFMGNSGGPWSI